MDRSQKADLVAELKNVFTETSVVVVTRNLGLSVAQSTDLRLKMRDAGAQFKVAKNRLALIALEGSRYKPIGDLLKGPTALATSAICESVLGEIMKAMSTRSFSPRLARFCTTNPRRRTSPSNLRSRPGWGWPLMRR